MEKIDLDYLRKQWKDEIKYYWESLEKEILVYYEIIKDTKSKEELLNEYSLTEEKLKDPLFIPEMLTLLKEIKKYNYDLFPKGRTTGNYNHYDHASYIYYTLIPKITPVAKKILDFKVNQYNKFYNKDELIVTEKKFIVQDFLKFGIVHYDSYIDNINRIAYDKELYVILPNLLRTLFENILNDIFSTSLKNKHKYLYFNENKRRIADFSILIDLLNQLSKFEYKDRIRSNITIKIIKY